ncbi:DUF3039 domain-containing protein [Streptomyces sp. NPDC056160]|uniref:DUF3039 domain-containing protein n=1 Tax=Streptomyces sp. NPDC056160 TaxID=3345731 RepID=UPI0035DF1412
MSTTLDRPGTNTDTDALFDSIVEKEERVKDDGTGDHDRLSHYVSKEDIVRSSMTGEPVFALCGKKWTPSKNPEKYPVCPECRENWESLKET